MARKSTCSFRVLLEEFNSRCIYCDCLVVIDNSHPLKQNSATRDHFIPLSKGGSNKVENIVLSCFLCNNKKGNNLIRVH